MSQCDELCLATSYDIAQGTWGIVPWIIRPAPQGGLQIFGPHDPAERAQPIRTTPLTPQVWGINKAPITQCHSMQYFSKKDQLFSKL